MFNVLYEDLPDTFNGVPIDTSYQTAIQIQEILSNRELVEREAIEIAISYLSGDDGSIPEELWVDCLSWWLNGWCNDDTVDAEDDVKVMDFGHDQWRIVSAFRSQYGIDLTDSNVDMHWWVFMGLLSTVNECAYTRVCDIRGKKLDSKMSADERSVYTKLKRIYSLQSEQEKQEIKEEKERILAILDD